MKIQFQCDYNEGCTPEILKALADTNMEQNIGYGEDPHCENARRIIREICGAPDAQVHFLVGGTQANATVISSILRPYQGVIAATTGHIAVHETGAIEHGGHKVIALPVVDGKITATQVGKCIEDHYQEDGPEKGDAGDTRSLPQIQCSVVCRWGQVGIWLGIFRSRPYIV